jgi:hypothetical protein
MPLSPAGPVLAQSAGPYPASDVIDSITWDWSTHTKAAPGSDLWPVTWADDGNLYTAWGDGGGFGGTNSDGRVSLGIARMEGPPESYSAVNINGGATPESSIVSFPDSNTGKSLGLLSVAGALYMWVNTQNANPPEFKLAWSTDRGATWDQSSWSFNSAVFAPSTCLNFGRGYAGASDNYIYFYGGKWGSDSKDVYLGRALPNGMQDPSTYEYFNGLDSSGNPTWISDVTVSQPVFTDPNSIEFNGALKPQVAYNPGIGRYLLTWWHKGPGGLGIFDAPAPWGPWTTVYYAEDFGGMTTGGEGLSSSFPTKWMSADGLTMWNVFSVWGSGAQQGVNGHDHFNLVKVTITLKGTTPSPIIVPFSVTLQGRSAPPDASWVLDFTVDLYTPGADRNTTPPLSSFSVTTDQNGQFTLNVPSGVYDIRAKGKNTLATELLNVDLTAPPASPVDLGLQKAGDYDGDNMAGQNEYDAQIAVFGNLTAALPGTHQLLDFNWDGVVDTIDYAILVQNFGTLGAPRPDSQVNRPGWALYPL